MPRSDRDLDTAAADVEWWLDHLDPELLREPEADASDLRRIGLAVINHRPDQEVTDAVHAARANGRSWSLIALALGMKRSLAEVEYGRHAPSAQQRNHVDLDEEAVYTKNGERLTREKLDAIAEYYDTHDSITGERLPPDA